MSVQKYNLKKEKLPFTQVANSVITSPYISSCAKAVYAYLFSKPENWDFSYIRISNDFKESKNTILKAIQELENNSLLDRKKQNTGRVNYIVKVPDNNIWSQGEKPKTKIATDQNSHSGNIGHISNKDIKVIKSNSNKDTSEETSQGKIFQDYVESLKPLNPTAYTKWFENTTQRKNINLLIKQFSLNQIKELVCFIELNKSKEYFPSITTPLQLVDKLPQVEKFYKSRGYKKKPNVIT